jgi:hypothetical protein
MTVDPKMSWSAVDTALDGLGGALDGGYLRIYASGSSPPAHADDAATGTLLIEHALDSPFSDGAENGVLTANDIGNDTSSVAGTADYFRLDNSDDECLFQGTIGTSNADLIIPTVSIPSGALISGVSLVLNMARAYEQVLYGPVTATLTGHVSSASSGTLQFIGTGSATITSRIAESASGLVITTITGTADITATGHVSAAGSQTQELTEVANLALTGSVNNYTYSYKRFTGNGSGSTDPDSAATVYISKGHHITFDHCQFDACSAVGTGTYANKRIGNDLKIVDLGDGTCHDISFEYCTFKHAYRIAVEINGGRNGAGQSFYNVHFHNCTWETSVAEQLSFDDDNHNAYGSEVTDCVLNGTGWSDAYSYDFPWTQNFEINQVDHFLIESNTFYASVIDGWNLQGLDQEMDWTFTDNILNMASPAGVHDGDGGQPWQMLRVTGGTWTGNVVTSEASDWCITYFTDCHDMDLSDTTWQGSTTAHENVDNSCSGITY